MQFENEIAMKAIVLYKSCTPEELKISEVPVPEVKPGWVLIKVKAFGLNRSELIMRSYEANSPIHKITPDTGYRMCG